MGSLLEWFRTKREEKIIKRAKEHSKTVFECVYEFDKAIEEYLNGDIKKSSKHVKKVNEIEREADELRREMLLDLSKGEMVPRVREDLAHLIKRLDDVANGANAAGRRLLLLETDAALMFMKQIKGELLEIMKNTMECCLLLRATIDDQLGSESTSILESVAEIKRLEHVVDNNRMNMLKKILDIESTTHLSIPPFLAIAVADLIECIESITDAAEAVGELIKVINLERQF